MKIALPMDRKRWVLLAATVFGGLGAWGANYYLTQTIETMRQQEAETVPVIVAKSELPEGAVISPETVSIREVPAEWAQSGALKPQEFAGVERGTLRTPLGEGEMLMWPMIDKPGEQSVASLVADGRRAVTVPVDEISSLSGMLQPNDRIDLIVTLDTDDQSVSFPLLQQVRVIATGTRLQRSGDEDTEAAGYSTITLDASPQEARRIIAARDAGRLTAMLRNPGDRRPLAEYRLSAGDLLGRPDPVKPASTPVSGAGMRIVYGDKL
jgi:pilus assembly protein CpaB